MSPSPSPGSEIYSRGDEVTLPNNDNNLENAFTAQEYINVDDSDDVRVTQTAMTGFAIFQFKDYVTAGSVHVKWEGQTNTSGALSSVFLQVFNQDSGAWETIDSSNSHAADADFLLEADITNTADYLAANGLMSCRVYQEAV